MKRLILLIAAALSCASARADVTGTDLRYKPTTTAGNISATNVFYVSGVYSNATTGVHGIVPSELKNLLNVGTTSTLTIGTLNASNATISSMVSTTAVLNSLTLTGFTNGYVFSTSGVLSATTGVSSLTFGASDLFTLGGTTGAITATQTTTAALQVTSLRASTIGIGVATSTNFALRVTQSSLNNPANGLNAFVLTAGTHTNVTIAGTEVNFNLNRLMTWQNGITLGPSQTYRGVLISPATMSVGTTATIGGGAYSLDISGPPVSQTGISVTNVAGLRIATASIGSGTVVNAYALSLTAPTGATTVNAAAMLMGNVGIMNAAPAATLHVTGTGIMDGITTTSLILPTLTGYLYGNGGGAVTTGTFLGTAGQVIVTGTNSLTFSTPQGISTTASPTFAGLQLNGSLTSTGTVTSITGLFTNITFSGQTGYLIANSGIVSVTTPVTSLTITANSQFSLASTTGALSLVQTTTASPQMLRIGLGLASTATNALLATVSTVTGNILSTTSPASYSGNYFGASNSAGTSVASLAGDGSTGATFTMRNSATLLADFGSTGATVFRVYSTGPRVNEGQTLAFCASSVTVAAGVYAPTAGVLQIVGTSSTTTAKLRGLVLDAGTAGTGTSGGPLKFTAGVLQTSPEIGVMNMTTNDGLVFTGPNGILNSVLTYTTGSTPTNTSAVNGYIKTTISGTDAWIPYYR